MKLFLFKYLGMEPNYYHRSIVIAAQNEEAAIEKIENTKFNIYTQKKDLVLKQTKDIEQPLEIFSDDFGMYPNDPR